MKVGGEPRRVEIGAAVFEDNRVLLRGRLTVKRLEASVLFCGPLLFVFAIHLGGGAGFFINWLVGPAIAYNAVKVWNRLETDIEMYPVALSINGDYIRLEDAGEFVCEMVSQRRSVVSLGGSTDMWLRLRYGGRHFVATLPRHRSGDIADRLNRMLDERRSAG